MVDHSSKCVLISMLGRIKNIQYSSCLDYESHENDLDPLATEEEDMFCFSHESCC